jgi:hypothetical protein
VLTTGHRLIIKVRVRVRISVLRTQDPSKTRTRRGPFVPLSTNQPTSSSVESGFWCFGALFFPKIIRLVDCKTPSTSLVNLPRGITMSGFPESTSTAVMVRFGTALLGPMPSHTKLLRTHTTAASAHMLYKLTARCCGETPNVAGTTHPVPLPHLQSTLSPFSSALKHQPESS